MTQSYPNTRLRRSRATPWSRAMVRETMLTPADLIWPLFITEGEAVEEPISSLPGVSRWSVDQIVVRAKEAIDLGIPCIALFPNTQSDRRSDDGAEALNPDNLMCRAIRAIKQAHGDAIGILTDVAGLLAVVDDPASLVSHTTAGELQSMIDDGRLTGGMIPKVAAALHAVQHGVGSAHLLDGRVAHVLLLELFSDAGIGTMITAEAST